MKESTETGLTPKQLQGRMEEFISLTERLVYKIEEMYRMLSPCANYGEHGNNFADKDKDVIEAKAALELMNAQKKLKWDQLIVTDEDGNNVGTLENLVKNHSPIIYGNEEVVNGKLVSLNGYFISAPDEDPNWDTPKRDVDWDGFFQSWWKHA